MSKYNPAKHTKRIVGLCDYLQTMGHPAGPLDPEQIAKLLSMWEDRGSFIKARCLDTQDDELKHWEYQDRELEVVITRLLPQYLPGIEGLELNDEPRGYYLRINPDIMRLRNYPLLTDMGGYGILGYE